VSGQRSLAKLLEADRGSVWHPYAPMPAPFPPLLVESAQGVRLSLAGGLELIDGMSSWWCAVHGYRVAELDAAAHAQLQRMSHVMFGGLTHEPAIELASALLERAPDRLRHVFFADSGSVAVEVALKLCLQAAVGRGEPRRTRVLALRGGYHGDTFGAMGVCDPIDGMHSMFAGALAKNVFAPRPPGGVQASPDEGYVAELERLFEEHGGELAAAICEPVVQGAGGMWFYSPEYVRVLRELCHRYGVLLVLDEIATGFGRAGTYFACERAGVAPDVLCVGKALTGGYMTLAATLCTAEIASAISAGPGGALMHGPTYMANPLACAIARASIDLLDRSDWQANVALIERVMTAALEPARELPGVADVRTLGAIAVIEMRERVDVSAATAAAVASGVWLRPFRNLIYAMPPYVTTDSDLEQIATAMLAAASRT